VVLAGNHVLVVGARSANLYGLAEEDPAQPLLSANAPQGYRFTSAALHGVQGALPWVALGALRIDVPDLALPDAPPGSASAHVQIVGGESSPSARLELRAWVAGTPRVEWTGRGRLIAFTPERVLVSRSRFQ
jgi:hypothetical protein